MDQTFRIGTGSSLSRLLIVSAMHVEETAIVNVLPGYSEKLISSDLGIVAKVFSAPGKELYLVNSGIGLVNAGVTTALIADRIALDGVILIGVAGALDEALQIGDAVLADRLVQHDSVHTDEGGVELMAAGHPFVSVKPEARENPVITLDQAFNAWISRIMMPHPKRGLMLSGSEFVGSSERKLQLASMHPLALAVEMESAGIASVTTKLGIPLGVVKTVADRLNPDGSIACDYNAFIGGACSNAAQVARLIWDNWRND